ncbi:MAG: hypothetical protein LBC80_02910 [Treponema sp.]|jgi:hypothetical protein|nr:hypothetical protein [Treponema sp.]
MKKFFITLLVLGVLAAGVFVPGLYAQPLTVNMYAEFFPELMRYTSNFGDWGNKNHASYRGDNTLDFLASTGEDILSKLTEVRFILNYNNGKGITAMVAMALDDYFIGHGIDDGTGGFLEHDDIDVSFNTLLNTVFTEWFIRGTFGMFTAYVGRTNDRGRVVRFNTAFDDLVLAQRLDNYGVLTPDMGSNGISSYPPYPFNSLNGIDNNNFLRQMQLGDRYRRYNQPYFSFSVNPRPFTFTIAGDLGETSGISPVKDGESYTRMNGAFRVSGERIFDRITFDAIYKFRGGDPRTLDTFNEPQGDGRGVTVHSAGLYANVLGVPGFGIGLGYTCLFRIYEDSHSRYSDPGFYDPNHELYRGYLTRKAPVFHGIDYRVQYTGIPQFTLTSINNFSFAVTQATNDPQKRIMPVNGTETMLAPNEGELWLGFHNSASVIYRWTRQLNVSLQLINRFGTVIRDVGGKKDSEAHNRLTTVASATYRFTPNVVLQSGIQCIYHSYNRTNTSGITTSSNLDSSRLFFAIPIRFRVDF